MVVSRTCIRQLLPPPPTPPLHCAGSATALAEAGLAEKFFAEFERQLERNGLLLKRGTMIDATLVATPFGRGPEHEADKEAAPPADADAALTARQGRRGTHYGYKAHAGVDVETRLIRRLVLTPANVNETMVADALVCGDERAVYADKAYAKRMRRAWLRSLGIKDRIMHKSWGGGPPCALQKRHNALQGGGEHTECAATALRRHQRDVRYLKVNERDVTTLTFNSGSGWRRDARRNPCECTPRSLRPHARSGTARRAPRRSARCRAGAETRCWPDARAPRTAPRS